MFRYILYAYLVLGPLYLIYKPPRRLIACFRRRWPDVLFYHPIEQKVIALTIDDAPSAHTSKIHRLLQCHHATATFFVIGSQVDGHRDDLVDLVRGGNELANHAMHDERSRSLSDTVLAEQISSVEHMIRDIYRQAGQPDAPKNWFFRPGSGFFSTRMRKLVGHMGYQLALGDVYPHDAQIRLASLNAKHILSQVKPGSIVVCHDRREWTLPMLSVVLPELRRRGYRVVTLSALLRERIYQ
ncbi:Polysaccharide deacetylase family protein [Penicillium ucsense]|uniref:chitin deacetylase n=1 Tax=Penicillium ucsense TaxID=2839758 RepID=A0A8J8WBS1_9EURO|nr:Polysaccharide deacetylase family protein [Penicillium ucsense]KAF7734860.1 Polysaccharide deacetylase family protein [Penicillium ucsense]